MNVVTGKIAPEAVNVDCALAIGQKMVAQFSANMPAGFYSPLKKEVITMETSKKGLKVGGKQAYDMEKIYGRLLVLSQRREINLEELSGFELSTVPSSLFDEFGDMSKGTKAVIVNKLAVFATTPLPEVDLKLVDGNEALYHTPWPKVGSVHVFAKLFCQWFHGSVETYVIFDKYVEGSVKS